MKELDLESQIYVTRCAEWAALNGAFPAWLENYSDWRGRGKDAFLAASLATIDVSRYFE